MQFFTETRSKDFFPYLGNYWNDISDDEKTLIKTYWSAMWSQFDKMYLDLYQTFLSQAIDYCPPYITEKGRYFEVVTSGVSKNSWLVDGSYTYSIPGILDMPYLYHKNSEPSYDGRPLTVYKKGTDYDIIEGWGIQFSSGVTPRVDYSYNGTDTYKSTLWAEELISYNRVLYELYGDAIGFDEIYFKNRSSSPYYVASGLEAKAFYEYDIPSSGLVVRFRAQDGYEDLGDGNIRWNATESAQGIYAQTISGLKPDFTQDELGRPVFRFDEDSVEFFEMSSGIDLSYYTVAAIAKSTGTAPYILAGDNSTHLAFAANDDNAAQSFGLNYSPFNPTMVGQITSNYTSNDVYVSTVTRFNDAITGHKAYLNNFFISDGNTLPLLSGIATVRYIGRRAYPTELALMQFGGDIHEILIYDRVLSDEEIDNIQRYAITKYNIDPLEPFYDKSVKGDCRFYKDLIEGLCKFSSAVPSVGNLTKCYALSRGLPFALEDGTASVSGDQITIGSYIYDLPSGLTPSVQDGDSVEKFDILSSGVYLWDNTTNSGLIDQFFSGVLPYNKYVYEDTISGLTEYSTQFLFDYLNLVNPAGLEFGIYVNQGDLDSGSDLTDTPGGGDKGGPPPIFQD